MANDDLSTSPARKAALITALNEHRINTIGELRRVERMFAAAGSPDLIQPMTTAWVHYVESNNLLSELRSLTVNFPFSAVCLEEAKRQVRLDPASNRSWNYCWLILTKIHASRLIPQSARIQAQDPSMWAGQVPTERAIVKLAEAFVDEWSAALMQLLRYWEAPPTR